MNNKTSSIPTMRYVKVNTNFTHAEPCGWQDAEWVQTVAIPDRAWGLNVVFRQGGMMYRNLPPHAIAFGPAPMPLNWTLDQAQLWNCYGSQYEHMECDHLADCRVKAMVRGEIFGGRYLFQTSFIGDSYSLHPEQDKTFFWIQLDNERLTVLPTNKVVFVDASFIDNIETLPKLKLQNDIYRCNE